MLLGGRGHSTCSTSEARTWGAFTAASLYCIRSTRGGRYGAHPARGTRTLARPQEPQKERKGRRFPQYVAHSACTLSRPRRSRIAPTVTRWIGDSPRISRDQGEPDHTVGRLHFAASCVCCNEHTN